MDEELVELQTEYIRNLPEKIDSIYELVLNLEKKVDFENSLAALKGIVHSIKGTAGSYEINFLSDLCHKFEDQLELLEKGKSEISKSFLFIDLMREYNDFFVPGEEIDDKEFEKKLNSLTGSFKIKEKPKKILSKKVLVLSLDPFVDDAISLALKKFNTKIVFSNGKIKGEKRFDFLFIDESAQSLISPKSDLQKIADKIIFLKSPGNVFLNKNIITIEKTHKLIRDIREAFQKVPSSKKPPGTILIIDDDESLHPLFKKAFKEFSNIKIIISGSSKEGLEKIEKEKIDLLVLDLIMPEINGKEFFKIMGKKGFKIPVIFLTGLSKPEEIKELIDLGAKGVVTKPFKISELAGLIMNLWYKV